MQVGDQVEASLLAGVIRQDGTIVAINGNKATIQFPPGDPFGIFTTRLIPNGPNKWKVYFNSGAEITDRREDF